VTSGGTAQWTTTTVRNINAGSDMTVTCTDLSAAHSISAKNVSALEVYVIDRGTASMPRVKAQVSYTNASGGAYASAQVSVSSVTQSTQRIYFSSPWLYAASSPRVKITLPKNNTTTGSEVRPFVLQAP
jgi:hypothetical protein